MGRIPIQSIAAYSGERTARTWSRDGHVKRRHFEIIAPITEICGVDTPKCIEATQMPINAETAELH